MSTPDDRVTPGPAESGAGLAPAAAAPPASPPAPAVAESLPGAAFDLADLDRDVVMPRVRHRRLPFLTALLAASAVAGVGVVGGILIQKHWGGSSGGAGGGGNAAAFAALRAARGAGGDLGAGVTGATGATGAAIPGAAGGRGFGGTAGTVKTIDGTTLYVTDTTGNIIKVTTVPGITVRVTKNGTLQDIHPGDTVIVQGEATGGVVAATAVTLGGAGGRFGGFGRGGGLGSGGGSGARAGAGAGAATGATGSDNGGGTPPALPGLGG